MKPFIYIAFIVLLFSCSNQIEKKSSKQERQIEPNTVDASLETSNRSNSTDSLKSIDNIKVTMTSDSSYCYVKEVISQNNQTYLKVDFIQFFIFKNTHQESKKRGNAEYEIKENGDTSYFVHNDYYIANDNPKPWYFRISEQTNIELIEVYGTTMIDFGNTEKAIKRIESSPFIITTNEGEVTQLKEVYIP